MQLGAQQGVGVERITPEVLREGLENFFRYHQFLDHARTRPIPHEGFNANAGYFYFFGHFYAAKVISPAARGRARYVVPPAQPPFGQDPVGQRWCQRLPTATLYGGGLHQFFAFRVCRRIWIR